jgi:acetolactate synthase-1/2/3 large subunit
MTIIQTDPTDKKSPPHPLAGTEMMGADMVIQVLADMGVDTIFGYSGGAILPTYDAIFRFNEKKPKKPINLVVPANEQGAGFMAAGYSRSSGRVGVALVTSGPGATNTVTPVRDCAADSIPMIVICGQVPRAAMGTDAFQEAPIFNIMSPCAKHTFLVLDPAELEATMRTAFEIATTGRPGPVVIDLPKDVQNWMGKFQGKGVIDFPGYRARLREVEESHVPVESGRDFYAMLQKSNRPLIYAGGGVINSGGAEALNKFAQELGIPAVTTLMGIGAVDTTWENCMHMLGMHGTAYANYAVEDCDFLIAVGSRFDDRVAGKVKEFAPGAQNIAHIDIDAAEIGKVKNITWSFIGDAAVAIKELHGMAKEFGFKKDFSAWHKHLAALKHKHRNQFKTEGDWIQPQDVIDRITKITKGEAIVTTGVGQHQMWAAQYFQFKHPRHWLTSGSMGTMGFGVPAAIGAQFANPDKLVICVDGDGSIRMNLGELETATTNNLPIKILLLNNTGDGMVRQWQKLMFEERFSGTDKTMHRKDFIKAAEADGYEYAVRLRDKSKMDQVLKEFVEFPGPAFLEVMIDPDAMVFPMVGPGKGYKDMLVGDYITPRDASESKALDGKTQADLF